VAPESGVTEKYIPPVYVVLIVPSGFLTFTVTSKASFAGTVVGTISSKRGDVASHSATWAETIGDTIKTIEYRNVSAKERERRIK